MKSKKEFSKYSAELFFYRDDSAINQIIKAEKQQSNKDIYL